MNETLSDLLERLTKLIKELETKLVYAEDAAAKGDLARQHAGGMEMEIQELKEENKKLQNRLFYYEQTRNQS